MNKLISILLFTGLLLTSLTASAATVIQVEVADLTSQSNPIDKRVGYIQNAKMFFRSATTNQDTDLLYDQARSAITIINHKDRTFMVLDEQSIAKFMSGTMQMMNRVQEQLNQQMKGMSPEQRAQIERMMGGMMQPPKQAESPPIKYIKTNKSQKVSGIACQITHMVKAGKPVTEVCLAKTNAVNMPAADLKTLLSMQATATKLAGAAAPLLERLGSEMPELGGQNLDGLPLMVTDLSGNSRTRMTVKSVTQGSVPKGAMSIPKGYRPSQLPSLKQ